MFRVEPYGEELVVITADRRSLKKLYDFLRSDGAFYAEGRTDVDFVVNGLSEEMDKNG